MANYTISTYTASLAASAAVADSVTLTITPDAGYVVSAIDFQHGSSSSSDLNGVSFSDSTTAGALGNTVVCAVGVDANYTMPGANTTLGIDIEGDAVLWNPVDGGGSNEVDTVVHVIDCGSNATVAYAAAGGSSLTNISGHHGKSGSRVTKTRATANSVTEIAQITVTSSNGYEFTSAPVLNHGFTSQSVANTEDMLSLNLKSVTATGGKTTAYVLGLMYKANSDFTAVDDITVCVDYAGQLTEVLADAITKIDYGSDYVNHLGETRTFKIYGKQGSKFTYSLQHTTGDIVGTTGTQTIPLAGEFNTGQGVFTFDAAIPAATTSAITLTVTPVSPTLNPTAGGQAAIVNTLSQKDEVDLEFSVTGGGIVGGLTITPDASVLDTTKAANKDIGELMHKRGTVSNFILKVIVGAPASSAYNVRDNPVWNYELSSTTANNAVAVTVASTTNLKVGWYVYGTGIPVGATISSITNSTTFELSANATATGASTLTYSTWSKSVAADNGGTVVNITNIVGSGDTDDYTLTANVSIERYGNADVVIDLPMQSILKSS